MQEIFSIQITKDELQQLIDERVQNAISENKPEPPRYYTRDEVCEMFNICLPTLHNMMKSGRIKALKVGRRTLFDAKAIDEAIERKETIKYRRNSL